MTEAMVEALGQGGASPGFTSREKLALQFAELMAVNHKQIDDDFFAALKQEFSAAQIIKGAVKIIARLTYRQRYEQSTGRDPFICPHCGHEMGVWRIWHPTYGVIHDEGEVIKRGTYASSAQRASP